MSSSTAVNGNWEISRSATDVLSISTGIVRAATSDNIQVIALLACEGFGATLPICPESCAKAHQLCSRGHESAVIAFLKAQIGFQKGDSGWQLSQSDAGLRFLALAACLLTIDRWRAAELLRELITGTAADRRLIPTSQQIKQLLIAINYRLACSGFADNVLGWKIWIEQTGFDNVLEINLPSSDALSQLISKLSDLERLGEAQSIHVEMPIAIGAWVIAFIKWCLGEPPTIILTKDGRTLTVLESTSRVYVYLDHTSGSRHFKISTQDIVGTITDLWKAQPVEVGDFNGMVHLPNLAGRLMMWFGPNTGLEYRAACEAISSGCRPVLDRFKRNYSQDGHQRLNINISLSQGTIFPDEEVIAHTLAEFLGQPERSVLKTLAEHTLVEDIPSVVAARIKIASFCQCVNCLSTTPQPKVRCSFDRFMRNVSKCIATVFLSSLLVSNALEGVFLHLPAARPNIHDQFTSAVYNCLRNSGENSCSNESIIDEVLRLVGRNDDRLNTTKDWVMSVHQGQTIYPQILSSLTMQKTGLLSLICVPGLIVHNKEKYNLVEVSRKVSHYDTGRRRDEDETDGSESDDDEVEDDPSIIKAGTIQTAQDRYEDSTVVWQVSTRDEKLFLSLEGPSGGFIRGRNPMQGVWAASTSFFVTCPHDRKTPFTVQKPWLIGQDPLGATTGRAKRGLTCILIQCDQNEPVRFFAVCTGIRCIIRDDACLSCCVQACQTLNMGTVIC